VGQTLFYSERIEFIFLFKETGWHCFRNLYLEYVPNSVPIRDKIHTRLIFSLSDGYVAFYFFFALGHAAILAAFFRKMVGFINLLMQINH
jgi:hypothetical protein